MKRIYSIDISPRRDTINGGSTIYIVSKNSELSVEDIDGSYNGNIRALVEEQYFADTDGANANQIDDGVNIDFSAFAEDVDDYIVISDRAYPSLKAIYFTSRSLDARMDAQPLPQYAEREAVIDAVRDACEALDSGKTGADMEKAIDALNKSAEPFNNPFWEQIANENEFEPMRYLLGYVPVLIDACSGNAKWQPDTSFILCNARTAHFWNRIQFDHDAFIADVKTAVRRTFDAMDAADADRTQESIEALKAERDSLLALFPMSPADMRGFDEQEIANLVMDAGNAVEWSKETINGHGHEWGFSVLYRDARTRL